MVNEGDTVAITFRNTLSQLLYHSLARPARACRPRRQPTRPVTAPNSERVYTFTLPIGSAGTYWYHTHAHGYAAEQAFRGLAGSLIVKAKRPLGAFA